MHPDRQPMRRTKHDAVLWYLHILSDQKQHGGADILQHCRYSQRYKHDSTGYCPSGTASAPVPTRCMQTACHRCCTYHIPMLSAVLRCYIVQNPKCSTRNILPVSRCQRHHSYIFQWLLKPIASSPSLHKDSFRLPLYRH